ncbi:MAG: pseudouridine synthase [Lachnospiraceae bacterium]|nr:pseudouridine synthase [Lachnospiraceae bacterium]
MNKEIQQFEQTNNAGEAIRLNRFLSEAGYCSRREADRLIEAGRVTVDGETAVMGQKVFPDQKICVEGELLTREEEQILLAVNKPVGVVCTTDRRWGDRTIYELIDYPKRVFSIGRLDKNSEGLLLMTNCGDLVNKIMRPGNAHEKEYLVTVDREMGTDFVRQMSEGVYLKELEVRTLPCRIVPLGKKRFRIILTQGLNRQIRRMCEALGFRVTALKRVRVMNIELGDLKPGEYRPVSREEYTKMMRLLQDSKNPGNC